MKVITAIVRGAIALLFAYYLVAFIWSVAGRIAYPYELEYYEGSIYLHTQRIIEGERVFVSPEEGFIPFPYSPLYYIFTIPFTWVMGQNIIAGRLASLISLAFIGWLIWRALYHSTRSRLAGLFAFGMFLALYYISGAWLDVCRIDIFLCAMFVGTVYFLKDFPDKKWGLLPSAAFLVASVYTKQVGIVFLIFIFPFLYTRDKKSACIYFLAVLASIAAIAGILNSLSGGWFLHYIYNVPQNRLFETWRFVHIFLYQDIPGMMPILFIGSILWVFIRSKVSARRTPLNIWEWTLPAALLASALPRSQPGGYENNLLPILLWCSIMFGFFLYHLPGYFERLIGSSETKEARRHWLMWQLIAYNFLLAQLILIFYIPTANGFPRRSDYPIIPTTADRQAGDKLLSYIRSFPGEVYLPTHNYYGWLAGKTPNLIITAATEHLKAGGASPKLIYKQVEEHHFDAIILNDPIPPRRQAFSYERAIIDNYYWAGNIPYDGPHAFYPTTGLWTRPNIVMLPLETLAGIDGEITGSPIQINRNGDSLLACHTNSGWSYFIDLENFTIADNIKTPFIEGAIVGATTDGRLTFLTSDSIYLLSEDGNFKAASLPAMDYPPAIYQAAIDPYGEFAAVGDRGQGHLVVIEVPTGHELGRWHVGSPIGRIILSPDGDRLYLTVGSSLSPIYKDNALYGSLYCYDVLRETEGMKIRAAWVLDWPERGREIRLSPDGKKLYWFNPRVASPISMFDTETPELINRLKNRAWKVRDIAFGEEPGEIFVHYTKSKHNGVAIMDSTRDSNLGEARLYYRPGWIVPTPDADSVMLFLPGTDKILRFKIYRKNTWPGEQEFIPE